MGANQGFEDRESIHMPRENVALEPTPPKGLKNLGNSCYMNASLQCLIQTPGLSEVLLNTVEGSGSRAQGALLKAYRGLILKQADADSRSTSELRRLKKALKQQHRQYGRFHQMDPTEFFLHIIGEFEEVSGELKQRLADLFGVEIETTQRCKDCGLESKKTVRTNSLPIPLRPADVEFCVINEEADSEQVRISCSEKWTSAEILKYVAAEKVTCNPRLVLLSESAVERVITRPEPFRKMNLHSRHLCFFDLGEQCILLEIKLYQKVLMTNLFRKLVSRKVQKDILAAEFCRMLREAVSNYFLTHQCKVKISFSPNRSMKFKLSDEGIDSRRLQDALSDYSEPVLRVRVDVNGHLRGSSERDLRHSIRRSDKGISLEDCFNEFLEVDHMGEENKVQCDECGKKTERAAWSRLKSSSRYLVVCLQRYNCFDTAKDTRTVGFTHEIDISRLMADPQPLRYSLYAVIKHRGTFTNGHYTSCVKGPRHWYHCNDSAVSVLDSAEVQKTIEQDAYVLFYQRTNC